MSKYYNYNGQRVKQKELCALLGIHPTTLMRQLKRGRTIEEIMENPRNQYELNGERHSLKEWASMAGVDVATIIHRLQRGWDLERALTSPALW